MGLYHKLADEFSRLEITGAGDRNCLNMTSHIQKFQELASALWNMCGEDNLIINMGGDLNQLVTNTVQCVAMPEPTNKQPTTTIIPISTPSPTQGFTTLNNGTCSTKLFNRVAFLFDAWSYQLSNPGKRKNITCLHPMFHWFSKNPNIIGAWKSLHSLYSIIYKRFISVGRQVRAVHQVQNGSLININGV